MSNACERIRTRKDRYLKGDLSPRWERRVDRHLVRCSECWERFQVDDPTLCFSRLESPARSEDFWRDWTSTLRAEIDRQARPSVVRGWRLGWVYGLAVPAVVLVAIVAVWLMSRDGSLREGAPRISERGIGRPSPGMVREAGFQLPTLEVPPSSAARVYSWKLEDLNEGTTEVILIFDESIDL